VTSRLDRYSTYAALGVFSVLAIYPLLSIIFLAFHKKTDNVTGFSLPTTISLHTFTAAWTEGGFAKGMWGSFSRAMRSGRCGFAARGSGSTS
jgi:ABC-type glycerol-3-phosphate transport system permease component